MRGYSAANNGGSSSTIARTKSGRFAASHAVSSPPDELPVTYAGMPIVVSTKAAKSAPIRFAVIGYPSGTTVMPWAG
ncbi:Uncharacterised protein [Mycobacterium tuberculosis]|nr:Uncharacterised protein [Mycobacterium tuberculosis]